VYARNSNSTRTPPKYRAAEAAALMGGRVVWGYPDAEFAGAAYDSRTVEPGQLFFATRGERTDGHRFVAAAALSGATCFVVSEWSDDQAAELSEALSGTSAGEVPPARTSPAVAVIQAADPVLAVGRLAAHHRSRFDLPVIGVTGSVGKTTAKDMAAHILEGRTDALISEGNLNSDVSMPIVLLRLDGQHRLALLEFATRGHGQLDYLVGLARPSVGAITEIAPVHLETLGSLAGVASAKAELLRGLPPSSVAIYNADSAILAAELAARPLPCDSATFGYSQDADVQIGEAVTLFERSCGQLSATLSFSLRCQPGPAAERLGLPSGVDIRGTLPYPGRHNVGNAVCAALAAAAVGVPFGEGLAALAGFRPRSEMRLDISVHHGLQIIDDAYNANPLAMAAALEILRAAARHGRMAAVLGDMRELGTVEAEAHAELGRRVASAGVDFLVCLGPAMAGAAGAAIRAGMSPKRVLVATDHAHAAQLALDWLEPGDTVLIKGSRGMAMEHVVAAIRRGWPGA
jgi:UDP-N-acetylmuramoyl-tripeptide--D-alanyl-D-alanine ligase